MNLPSIQFNRGVNGWGYPLPGSDFISGFAFYDDILPGSFTSNSRVKKFFSITDAENAGIVSTHADETPATGGNVAITVKGAAGDVDSIFFDGVLLGQVTVPGTPYTDTSAEATAIRAAINALTQYHGFVASGSTANVALAIPAKFGVQPNGGSHITFTSVAAIGGTGTATATVTQFSAGVGSRLAFMHYHISEYFRTQPNGVLYTGIFAKATFTGIEVSTMQTAANGTIRELAIFDCDDTFTSGQLTAIQSYCTTEQTNHRPLSVLFHANCVSLTLSTIPDISTLSNKNVSFILSQEGDYKVQAYSNAVTYNVGNKVIWGNSIYQAQNQTVGNAPYYPAYWTVIRQNLLVICGYSISNLGQALGTVSLAAVNENIGWVAKFNAVNPLDNGLDNAGLATGDLIANLSNSALNTLNAQHYIFLRKHVDKVGSYFNDDWTAIAETNDYCHIANNRTMDKAERNVYQALLPNTLAPLYVNANGTLTDSTIAIWVNQAQKPLDDMVTAKEISATKAAMDPTQNVISTGQVVLSFQNISTGVARTIIVNDKLTTQIV